MIDKPDIKPGAFFEVAHPFVVNRGGNPEWEWRPGCRNEQVSPDDFGFFADAIGTQIITVVSIHRPGSYRTRVFYTRRWRDPDDNEFGRESLRVTSIGTFRKIIAGYRLPFELSGGAPALEHQKVKALA